MDSACQFRRRAQVVGLHQEDFLHAYIKSIVSQRFSMKQTELLSKPGGGSRAAHQAMTNFVKNGPLAAATGAGPSTHQYFDHLLSQ